MLLDEEAIESDFLLDSDLNCIERSRDLILISTGKALELSAINESFFLLQLLVEM